ncbi:MAG: PilZ domain-containing protein [Desulfuromonadales bacterium]|nr:PilZ domain-containing protein [Desulfuromonadales bacterium]
MSYGKYFNKGQKVFLKRIFGEDESQTALDTLTGYAMHSRPMQLELALPYGSDAAESYPFVPDMKFEVMTDNKGMGLRLTASFLERTSGTDIRLQFEGNLEFISRRIFPRVDVNAWVGIERSSGNLAEMRSLWQESLGKIKSGVSAAELTEFEKHLLNLAGGGMRMPLEAPVEMAELLLLYLSIGDKKGIICALAEVVWIGKVEDDDTQQTGLRFLNILEEDQKRIDAVVKILLDRLGKTGEEDEEDEED